jgi:hypothetical protein
MKNLKPLVPVAIMLLTFSCKKNDFREESSEVQQTSNEVSEAPLTVAETWQSPSNWEQSKQKKYTVFYTKITDEAITADVVSKGLVLAYQKNGEAIQSLPYEDKKSSSYWYHQISEGSILILCDSYGTYSPASGNSFTYLVITPDELKTLQANGHSVGDLMSLSYDQVKSLLD